MFSPDFLDSIRARVALTALIGSRVKLRKAGRDVIGCCPFHQERSPSFHIYPDHFHCFSCGEHGDCFAWIMKVEGRTFTEAVERLADHVGLPLPQRDTRLVERLAKRQEQINANEAQAAAYVLGLGPNHRTFLRSRGLTDATVQTFGYGAGTGAFRDRLIVPIRSADGRVAGFAGRALGDATPKWLNSPDSDTFHKGDLIYNAHSARTVQGDLVVVEGYFDVAMATQAGFRAVATMGTAVTEAQALGLWRMAASPVVVFDGDAAGRAAAKRLIQTAIPLLQPGRDLKFAFLPNGYDPDLLIRERGPQALGRAVERAMTMVDAHWHLEAENAPTASLGALTALSNRLIGQLDPLPDLELRREWQQNIKDRIVSLARRKPVIRANGHSHHSTNPGSIRLVNPIQNSAGFNLKEAVEIVRLVHNPANWRDDVVAKPGLSERTNQVIAELAYLIGTIPTEELRIALADTKTGQAVEEAFEVVHHAGVHAYD